MTKGTTASIFQGQVWARTINTLKAAGGTKAIHLYTMETELKKAIHQEFEQ